VDLLIGQRGLERRHQVRQPDGLGAEADRAHEHVIGQRVHHAPVREILRLDGQIRAARPVALAGLAVAGRAVLDVDLLAGGDMRVGPGVRRRRLAASRRRLRLRHRILRPAEEPDQHAGDENDYGDERSAQAHGADCTLFHPPR
jgi:hypothetical protein